MRAKAIWGGSLNIAGEVFGLGEVDVGLIE